LCPLFLKIQQQKLTFADNLGMYFAAKPLSLPSAAFTLPTTQASFPQTQKLKTTICPALTPGKEKIWQNKSPTPLAARYHETAHIKTKSSVFTAHEHIIAQARAFTWKRSVRDNGYRRSDNGSPVSAQTKIELTVNKATGEIKLMNHYPNAPQRDSLIYIQGSLNVQNQVIALNVKDIGKLTKIFKSVSREAKHSLRYLMRKGLEPITFDASASADDATKRLQNLFAIENLSPSASTIMGTQATWYTTGGELFTGKIVLDEDGNIQGGSVNRPDYMSPRGTNYTLAGQSGTPVFIVLNGKTLLHWEPVKSLTESQQAAMEKLFASQEPERSRSMAEYPFMLDMALARNFGSLCFAITDNILNGDFAHDLVLVREKNGDWAVRVVDNFTGNFPTIRLKGYYTPYKNGTPSETTITYEFRGMWDLELQDQLAILIQNFSGFPGITTQEVDSSV
jgi:hypothetical protein